MRIFPERRIIENACSLHCGIFMEIMERYGFIDINKNRDNNVEATKNSDRCSNLLRCRPPDMIQ